MIDSCKVTPCIIGVGDKLSSSLIVYRYNVTLYILLKSEGRPSRITSAIRGIQHTYRRIRIIVEVNYLCITRFLSHYKIARKRISCFYSVFGLACTDTVLVVRMKLSFSASGFPEALTFFEAFGY